MEKVVLALNAKVLAANKLQDVRNKFNALHTDAERIIFALNLMSEFNIVPPVCDDTKNARESEVLREQGNKVFVSTPLESSTCVEALKLYTKSIAYAPYPSEQLALAYANRSAVLIKVHKYEECIRDIDRALALSYPDNLRAKLYVRRVECLKALQHSDVESAMKEAQQWLERMSLNDVNRKKLNDKLISIREVSFKQSIKNAKAAKNHAPLSEIKKYNPESTSASDAISIAYSDQYGRHIIASRDIKAGEVIVMEKPYSSLLTPTNMQTHCSNCLKVCWANIPCDYCTYAMYCSEECKALEWKKFHDVECAVFPALLKMDFSKLDLFSLRLAIQAVRESSSIQELRELLEEVDNCTDPRTKGFCNGVFESNHYRSILSLVTNAEKRSFQDLFRRSMDSCFILYYLATCTNMFGSMLKQNLPDLINNSDVIFVGGLIMRHQQIIPCNFHSFSEVCKVDLVECGIAAFPFLSLINHSCSPNMVRSGRHNLEIAYVMYPIKKGEQILDNYGQFHAITPKHARQKELLKQYHFKCNCVPCQEDWPLYMQLKSFKDLVKKKEDQNKVSKALRKFDTYMDIAAKGNVSNVPNMVNDLLKMIEVILQIVPMPCLEMCHVVETLKFVYDLGGSRFDVPEL